MTTPPAASIILAAGFLTGALALLAWAAIEWAKFLSARNTTRLANRARERAEQQRAEALAKTVAAIKTAPTARAISAAVEALPSGLTADQLGHVTHIIKQRQADLAAHFLVRN